MRDTKQGLPPIIRDQSQVLILGSLPGDLSIAKQQYYAKPSNHFWKIIAGVYDVDLPPDYERRIEFLLQQHIALWDVLDRADRVGSLDSNIRNAVPNDIARLLGEYPSINTIALNGGTASRQFRKTQKTLVASRVTVIHLPSSSGVPGKNVLPLTEKIERWKAIRVPAGL
jgi:hypoxanthine-DNA glycosylase